MSNPPNVRACLFDMDGLLIDSERIYTEVTNKFLASHGKGPLPAEIKAQLMGRTGPQASKVLLEWAELDITADELYTTTTALQEEMWSSVKPLPGAEKLIQSLVAHNIPIALATSSHRLKYLAKTFHLQEDFFAHFPENKVVVGDDPRIAPGRGKPHGVEDIYLLALETINDGLPEDQKISPSECLVFEDAVLGVEAGKNAGMQIVWCPDGFIKNAFAGKEEEILGHWGREVASLDEVNLAEYGIGR